MHVFLQNNYSSHTIKHFTGVMVHINNTPDRLTHIFAFDTQKKQKKRFVS